MNIILLGHRDIASLFALNRLIALSPEHHYTAFTSGTLTAEKPVPDALVELARIDAELCKQYLAEYPVANVLRAAPELQAPNSAEGLQRLAECEPDLIVSIRYRRILRDAAISIPRQGILNLHSGILPDYRGVMATFWAMLNDEPEIGCTLHWIVDSGIDTGPVIGISRTATRPAESYLQNLLRLYSDGGEMLVSAIADRDCGKTLGGNPQSPSVGRYFSTPDEAAIKAFTAQNLCMASGEELGLAHRPG